MTDWSIGCMIHSFVVWLSISLFMYASKIRWEATRSIIILPGSCCFRANLHTVSACMCEYAWRCNHFVFAHTAVILWSQSCVGQDGLREEMKTNEQRAAKHSCSQLHITYPPSPPAIFLLSLFSSLYLKEYYKATQKDSCHGNEKHNSVDLFLLLSRHRQLIPQWWLAEACGAIILTLNPAVHGGCL